LHIYKFEVLKVASLNVYRPTAVIRLTYVQRELMRARTGCELPNPSHIDKTLQMQLSFPGFYSTEPITCLGKCILKLKAARIQN